MQSLPSDTAILLVRKNLDEVEPNDSVMYTDENNDNLSLNDIIRKNLPEAINAIHLAAPVHLLEGEDFSFMPSAVTITSDGVLDFTLINEQGQEEQAFLRLVFFRATKTGGPEDRIVTDVIPESSAEAHKQLNPYIRGNYDRPILVKKQELAGDSGKAPKFAFYSVRDLSRFSGADPMSAYMAISRFNYIKELAYVAPTTQTPNPSYKISSRLRQNIIDYLTAMVMETYGDQRAQNFYQRASNFHKT